MPRDNAGVTIEGVPLSLVREAGRQPAKKARRIWEGGGALGEVTVNGSAA